MYYTGLERYTDEELSRMAHGSNNRVSIELARRLDAKTPKTAPHSFHADRAAPCGLNPIPIDIGEEE
jgi:hypothetical protein